MNSITDMLCELQSVLESAKSMTEEAFELVESRLEEMMDESENDEQFDHMELAANELENTVDHLEDTLGNILNAMMALATEEE